MLRAYPPLRKKASIKVTIQKFLFDGLKHCFPLHDDEHNLDRKGTVVRQAVQAKFFDWLHRQPFTKYFLPGSSFSILEREPCIAV